MDREQEVSEVQESAFLLSLGLFFVLFGSVVSLVLFFNVSAVNLLPVLLVLSFVCCALLASTIYAFIIRRNEKPAPVLPLSPDTTQSVYTELYQKSPVPYFVIDAIGRVTSANTAAARLLGVPQKKLVGLHIFDWLATEEPGHKEFLVNKFNSGVAMSDEMVRVSRKDHREAWGLLSLFQFQNDYGERQGLLTLVDITKQKKAEDAKSEFVSLASHQLRTPIAGMKWSVELLQLDSPETLTQRQLKYMNRLLTSIERMSRLVDDFLRVSRFELGNFQPEFQSLTLADLCNDVLLEFTEVAKHKEVTIHTDYDPAVTHIVTDPNLLRMVITNLCSNAVKYTPPGGTVTVRYRHVDAMLQIQISDTGMGIPVGDQEHIFSKLFRASNAVRDIPDGTGLGLYIVREAVAVLRGKASFTSAEGMGTTFEVQIPYEVGD